MSDDSNGGNPEQPASTGADGEAQDKGSFRPRLLENVSIVFIVAVFFYLFVLPQSPPRLLVKTTGPKFNENFKTWELAVRVSETDSKLCALYMPIRFDQPVTFESSRPDAIRGTTTAWELEDGDTVFDLSLDRASLKIIGSCEDYIELSFMSETQARILDPDLIAANSKVCIESEIGRDGEQLDDSGPRRPWWKVLLDWVLGCGAAAAALDRLRVFTLIGIAARRLGKHSKGGEVK